MGEEKKSHNTALYEAHRLFSYGRHLMKEEKKIEQNYLFPHEMGNKNKNIWEKYVSTLTVLLLNILLFSRLCLFYS